MTELRILRWREDPGLFRQVLSAITNVLIEGGRRVRGEREGKGDMSTDQRDLKNVTHLVLKTKEGAASQGIQVVSRR